MPLQYAICDVFTDRPLAGNQLAVFPDARDVPEALLQPLAREINFAETVFVYPPTSGGSARVRIFTPSVELPFAGHPVLGTAIVLGTRRGLSTVVLETGSGLVPVALERLSPRRGFGRMQQPVPTVAPFPAAPQLLAALGVVSSRLPVELYDNGPRHVYVALGSEDDVAGLRPDLTALRRLGAITVNCFAGAGRRWKTRMFAPALGIAEDPASGSPAGPLACHLARHGLIPFGDEIEISQGTEIGRPSVLFARARGSRDRIQAVEVAGAAVIVGRGEFDLDEEPLRVLPGVWPSMEFLYEVAMDVEVQDVGMTPGGHRRFVHVTGGTFEGPRLRGRVLPGGGDWLLGRADGSRRLDVRITLQTDDGALIYAHYGGVFDGRPDVLDRIRDGAPVDVSEYYFRTAPMFETAAAKYDWLNRILAVGIGKRTPTQVAYTVYAIL